MSKKLNIAVLTTSPNSNKSIEKAIEKRGHKCIMLNPNDLYLLISDSEKGYDRIYEGEQYKTQPTRLKAKDIDAVIPRIGSNLGYGTAVLEHMQGNLKIFSTATADGIKTAADKLISMQRISQAKIKVPKTVIGDNMFHPDFLIKSVGGLKAFAKVLSGSQGIGVFPLNDIQQTNAMLESFHKSKTKLLIQQYIDSGAKDIRCIVIGGKAVLAMERTAKEGELRSNISLGGSGKKIELSDEDKNMCVRAAKAVGLPYFCGVDLMKDKDGTSYIIEANSNPGLKIEEITGESVSEPLIEFVEKSYKGGSVLNELEAMHHSLLFKRYYNLILGKAGTELNVLADSIFLNEIFPTDADDEPPQPKSKYKKVFR